ncbi:MAG: ABC transporter permease subunit [Chloroflexi bacterium]|uniref:ABC transporter permease n=1 Tax=Candidatus Flexifilum breve TaxID=3140694 RepID=UPI003136B461|nr:ABC transporter permease subunit [Chloroflexota bacterium]
MARDVDVGRGFALIALVQAVVLGDVDALRGFADLVASMPPFLLQFLGTDDVNVLATPEGYLAGRFFSFVVVMFAVYAVLSGLNITAADEDRGILNSVLSTPLPRWQLIAGKFAAYAVLLLGVTLITFAGAAGGVLSTQGGRYLPDGSAVRNDDCAVPNWPGRAGVHGAARSFATEPLAGDDDRLWRGDRQFLPQFPRCIGRG